MAKTPISPVVDPSAVVTGVGSTTIIPVQTFSQAWNDCPHLTVNEAIRIVLSQFVEVPGLDSVGEEGYHRDFCMAIVGEAGITKTVSIREAAKANDLGFMILAFAGVEVGDHLPVNLMQEDPDRPGQYRKLTNGPLFRRPETKSGLGIALINEGLGANVDQQKQMRSFISNRELGGAKVHKGWIFVLDSNPATNKYFTNRNLDASLEHRMFCLAVDSDVKAALRRWSAPKGDLSVPRLPSPAEVKPVPVTLWGINSTVYDFLRMSPQYFECGFDRRWEMFSIVYNRMLASGLVDANTLSKFIHLAWPREVADAFKATLAKGTEQKYWPIHGNVLLYASEAEFNKLKVTLELWKSEASLNNMISFTLLNVQDLIGNEGFSFGKKSLQRLGDFVQYLNNNQLHQLINTPNITETKSTEMWNMLSTRFPQLVQTASKQVVQAGSYR